MRKLIRAVVKQTAPDFMKRQWRQTVLGRAVRRISALGPGEVPDHELLESLRYGWGNVGASAGAEYLGRMYKLAMEADGPVLECGTGVSTILLGLVAMKTPKAKVWSFEQSPEWAVRTKQSLDRYGLHDVEVCDTPLRDFGGYSWYEKPSESLPEGFKFVVCDGPPGSTPGGRYGLFPQISSNFAPGCKVLLDDANRENEKRALERWQNENDINVEFDGQERAYALITVN